jgi:O-acetylserine/cysteine efflux transporter
MSQVRIALAGLMAVSLLWGAGYVAGAQALAGGFGPLWLTASRLLVPGVLLSVLARVLGRRPVDRAALPGVVASGVLAWAMGTGFQTVGQLTVPPGTTALILAGGPFVAVGIDAFRTRTWPHPRALIGVALATGGIALLVAPSGVAWSGGVGWVVAACVAWAAAQVWEAGRTGASAPDPLSVAALQVLAGGVGLAVAAVVTGEPLPVPTDAGWLGWTWLMAGCTVVGLPLWLWVLRLLPIHVSMLQGLISPVVALGLAVAAGEQGLGLREAVGASLVLLATVASMLDARSPKRVDPPSRSTGVVSELDLATRGHR